MSRETRYRKEVGYAADLRRPLLCILSIAGDLAIKVREFDVLRICSTPGTPGGLPAPIQNP